MKYKILMVLGLSIALFSGCSDDGNAVENNEEYTSGYYYDYIDNSDGYASYNDGTGYGDGLGTDTGDGTGYNSVLNGSGNGTANGYNTSVDGITMN